MATCGRRFSPYSRTDGVGADGLGAPGARATPDIVSMYVSQPVTFENRSYEWQFPTWSCSECSATFLFEAGYGDVLQLAVHRGGQMRQWPVGQSGMCPRCGVYWLQVPQQ